MGCQSSTPEVIEPEHMAVSKGGSTIMPKKHYKSDVPEGAKEVSFMLFLSFADLRTIYNP
jgi:hypothetical protein